MLVPMFAPMMIPIACFSFIIPELTKPMTITVVAEEDWITLVTQVPSATPFSGVLVIRYRNASSLLPATSFRPSPIKDIPNRNNATPESKDKIIENTAIFFSSVAVPSALYFFRNSSFCKVFFYIFLTLFFLIFNLIHIYYAISMPRLQYLIPLYLKKIIFSTAKCSAFPSVKKERALNTLSFAILIYLFFFIL